MIRSSHRRRIAVLAILGLLFQQLAMVAYACVLDMPSAVQAPKMEAHCPGMGADMPVLPLPGDGADASMILCERHCDPDDAVAADMVKLSVPALVLSAMAFLPVRDVATQGAPLLAGDGGWVPSGPPPRLRFCSLLI